MRDINSMIPGVFGMPGVAAINGIADLIRDELILRKLKVFLGSNNCRFRGGSIPLFITSPKECIDDVTKAVNSYCTSELGGTMIGVRLESPDIKYVVPMLSDGNILNRDLMIGINRIVKGGYKLNKLIVDRLGESNASIIMNLISSFNEPEITESCKIVVDAGTYLSGDYRLPRAISVLDGWVEFLSMNVDHMLRYDYMIEAHIDILADSEDNGYCIPVFTNLSHDMESVEIKDANTSRADENSGTPIESESIEEQCIPVKLNTELSSVFDSKSMDALSKLVEYLGDNMASTCYVNTKYTFYCEEADVKLPDNICTINGDYIDRIRDRQYEFMEDITTVPGVVNENEQEILIYYETDINQDGIVSLTVPADSECKHNNPFEAIAAKMAGN